MTFEDATKLMIDVQEKAIALEVNQQRATYRIGTIQTVMRRHEDLENALCKAYPDSWLYAYTAKNSNELHTNWEVFLRIENDYYNVICNTRHLEKGEVIFSAFHIDQANKKAWTTFQKHTELNLVNQHYPAFETRVVEFLRELPTYRLFFETQDIETRRSPG